jgi:ribose 5-phosphate isomerase B
MKVAIGCDEAAYDLKETLKTFIITEGHEVADFGAFDRNPTLYPDIAHAVAAAIAAGKHDCGVLLCGTGIGMAITANKVPGIRAANIASEYEAQMSREHNDLNVLTLGARILDEADAKQIVQIWLDTPFSGGRHSGRLDKIHDIEQART